MNPFDDILGHEKPIEVLTGAVASGRVHHAYLFSGPSGVGKRMVAFAFAQALNCVEPPRPGYPCGVCRPCEKIAQGIHPDVTLVEPDRSKARWRLKIEVVREITRQVNYKPYEGRRRVIMIDDVHTVTVEGANAFLKTLEEPTGDTIFVLLTPQPRSLLTTIRSRCQALRFAPLTTSQVQGLLRAAEVGPELAELAAVFSEGSVDKALALCEEGVLEERRTLLQALVHLADEDELAVFKQADTLARKNKPDELSLKLDFLKIFFRDVMLHKSEVPPGRLANQDMLPTVAEVAEAMTMEEVMGHLEHVGQVQHGLSRYVDSRLLLEDLLLSMAGLERQ